MGSVTADYSSSQLTDSRGVKASYDTESLYYGLHFGTGYIWKITDAASFDVYGKYLWTHQDGDSIRLSTGDPVKFDDVDSHRLRGGGRFAYAINEFVSPYIGAAYEHEFDGKANASTYGYAIDAPNLTGGTGIGEVGLTIKTGSIVSLDVGAQGYTGKREGVTGSLQLKIEF
jgi:outer membrane autotransporter protein